MWTWQPAVQPRAFAAYAAAGAQHSPANMHLAPAADAPDAKAYARASAPVPEPWDTSIEPFSQAVALPAAAASSQVMFPEPEAISLLSSSKWSRSTLLFTIISPFSVCITSILDQNWAYHSAKCIFHI